MGCGVCIGVCPTKALTMVPQHEEAAQAEVFEYTVNKVSRKPEMEDIKTVKGSQFKQPLLEFSGSCAGCAETSYARLITQVCGDRMYIAVRHGLTPCSRTTLSTVWACIMARRHCVRT